MKNKIQNLVADYILKKLSKDSVAYQAVLQEIPLSFSFLRKCISNGLSIVRSGKEIILSDRALHRVNRKMQFKLYHVPRGRIY